MCSVNASASMASIAPGANATMMSAIRTWVVSTMIATKIAEMAMAMAKEPSPALTWPSRALVFIRAKRVPINAPIPTSATPRRQDGDLRQRAGACREECGGAVPGVNALQVEARAEGRAECRQRQQADGQRIGADMLDQLPRRQRAQRNPEQHQYRLSNVRRHSERPPGQCRDADGNHGAGDQPARKICPKKQQTPSGADRQRFKRTEYLGAARKCHRYRSRKLRHGAL